MQTESVAIYLSSRERTAGTSEAFTITLAQPLARVVSVDVLSVEIPLTYYVCNTANNTIEWTDGSATHSATIPPGNYAATDFAAALTTAMDAVVAGFHVAYTATTMQLTFTGAAAFGLLVASSCARLVGITADTAIATTVVPQSVIDLAGTRFISVMSTALVRPKSTLPRENTATAYTLYHMPITGNTGDVQADRNTYPSPLQYGVRQTLGTIDLALVDDVGAPVLLNGSDWSISLTVMIS